MRNVMHWKVWFRDNSDIIRQVYTTDDILAAKKEGKTGIILGWQNITGIEDQIGYLGLFKEAWHRHHSDGLQHAKPNRHRLLRNQ